jgi:hypothetical protein
MVDENDDLTNVVPFPGRTWLDLPDEGLVLDEGASAGMVTDQPEASFALYPKLTPIEGPRLRSASPSSCSP